MYPPSAIDTARSSACRRFLADPPTYVWRMTSTSVARPMPPAQPPRKVRPVNWFERQVERCRALPPVFVDAGAVAGFSVIGLATVFTQDVKDGLREPTGLAVLTVLLTCAPMAIRRRAPLSVLTVSTIALLVHVLADFPEGTLPVASMFLTYSVAAWSPLREAVIGLVVVDAMLVILGLAHTAGLDTASVLGNLAFFGVADRPLRFAGVEAALATHGVDAAVALLRTTLEPIADLYHAAATKSHLAGVLLRRVAEELHA